MARKLQQARGPERASQPASGSTGWRAGRPACWPFGCQPDRRLAAWLTCGPLADQVLAGDRQGFKILAQKMSKNSSKVAIHGRFDRKFGIGLKNDAEIIRNYFRSSHVDSFRDQKSFLKIRG